MFWVAEAWDEVPADSIAKSWKMLYTEPEFDDEDDTPLAVVRDRLLLSRQKLMDQDNTVHEEDVELDIMNDDDIVNIVCTRTHRSTMAKIRFRLSREQMLHPFWNHTRMMWMMILNIVFQMEQFYRESTK